MASITPSARFEKIVALYIQTKDLIIAAEESDAKVSSNIAIIREQRDALDHLMRVLGDDYAETPRGDSYCEENLEKAIGHLYRAAYDALDSLAISLKIRIAKAVDGYDNAALTAVFPKYYSEYCAELDAINQRVSNSRATKDIGAITDNHMDEYKRAVDRLWIITRDAEQKVPSLVEYTARQRKSSILNLLGKILLLILSALIGGAATLYFK